MVERLILLQRERDIFELMSGVDIIRLEERGRSEINSHALYEGRNKGCACFLALKRGSGPIKLEIPFDDILIEVGNSNGSLIITDSIKNAYMEKIYHESNPDEYARATCIIAHSKFLHLH